MSILKNRRKILESISPNLYFLFWLLLFVLIYDYPSIIFKRPQSVHHWRQSDCASLALNYYQSGMHFFKPQTHNLTSDDNTTGYSAPSELPVGYYFIAILYKIFGYHDFIFRFINTIIFLLGLFYLFKICSLFFNDFFWSSAIPLFLFTSPVLVYYGNNFLTDSSAFAFALIAWYFFLKYYFNKKLKYYYISMLFFLLAGSFKISALISLAAILILFIIESAGIIKVKSESKIFTKPILNLVPVFLIIFIIGSWVYFAKSYNISHRTGYFSTGVFPVWNLDNSEIRIVIKNIKELWLNQYFHVYSLFFFGAVFLISIVFIRKTNRFLMLTSLIFLLGAALFSVLWFRTLKDHDYYIINLYILLVFIVLNSGLLFKTHLPVIYSSRYTKVLFLFFLLFNLHYARKQLNDRYYGWWTEYKDYKDYHTITPYLRNLGIRQLDTVVCLPDNSHFTLYLMNQRGWTECMGYNSDSASITYSIYHGAKYLIVNGNEVIKRKYLLSFIKNPVGQFNNIKIYRLDKPDSLN
jgi:hypothetical protein